MAEPKYDAILNYSKFYEFINRNKMHLKDSRYLVDDGDVDIEEELTLYTDIEITNAPHDDWNEWKETDFIQIGRSHSTWDFRYRQMVPSMRLLWNPLMSIVRCWTMRELLMNWFLLLTIGIPLNYFYSRKVLLILMGKLNFGMRKLVTLDMVS